MKKDDLRKTVDHLWSFLDDLAESDPAAYKEFVSKQLKEGRANLPNRKDSNKKPVNADQKKKESKPTPSIVLPFKSALTDNSVFADDSNEGDIHLPVEAETVNSRQRKVLIEEVKETPKFSLTEMDSWILLDIDLPLLESIKEVSVDISDQEVILDCPEYALQVHFRNPISSEKYKAKWLKKKRKLIISQ